jgi:hypothetical protein
VQNNNALSRICDSDEPSWKCERRSKFVLLAEAIVAAILYPASCGGRALQILCQIMTLPMQYLLRPGQFGFPNAAATSLALLFLQLSLFYGGIPHAGPPVADCALPGEIPRR